MLRFREKRPLYRVLAMECGLTRFCEAVGGGVVNLYANEWEDHPSHWGTPTPPSFDPALELSCHLWVCLLAYRLGIKVYLNLTCHLGPN